MNETFYEIEYEIPPLRAIYNAEIVANSEESAVKCFRINKEKGRIRNINERRVRDDERILQEV